MRAFEAIHDSEVGPRFSIMLDASRLQKIDSSIIPILVEWVGRNRSELLHQIIHQEPRPPRQVETTIPYELETIILKAVAKNPAERYATAKDLAADLDRYLEDKPILAKRPSMVERARK